MVIVLFLLIILLFPFRFYAKITLEPQNTYFNVSLFLYKIFLANFTLVNDKGYLYVVITKFKPISIKQEDKKKRKIPVNYDFFKGEKLEARITLGLSNCSSTALVVGILSILSPLLCHIIDDRLLINVTPDFSKKRIGAVANLRLYTCLGLVIIQFIKKALKGVKYALQQSN